MGNRWWEIDIPGIIIGILSILTLNFDNFKKYRLK
jgi:fatty-acid desaturase